MSIRTIEYVLDDCGNMLSGVTKSGVQYEQNATAVEYTVSDTLANKIMSDYSADRLEFRIDFDTDACGYNPSAPIERVDGTVTRNIPRSETQSKVCRVNLVISAIKNDAVIAQISSAQSRICFLPVVRTDTPETDRLESDIADICVFIEQAKSDVSANKTASDAILSNINAKKILIDAAQASCLESKNSAAESAADAKECYDELKAIITSQRILPIVTNSDNGKILRVVSGKWEADTLIDAGEEEF